ncbi:MAG TPA: toll/interleukin-1 receptor domain-containing protein, partial [Candidatus Limnocylindrales bacterium]|nr:toll/interleukin-1 receptor domain-containing protein [Candidatus Limnocylindrales bacterium]
MAHDVFICHSSKDRTIANAICSTLEQHHIRCWIAPRDVLPGTDYGGAITEAISTTRLTVLVFSSNSNESTHVRREIERTISHGIPVLPFRVEEITPSPALEYFISDAHWLDAMTPPLEQHLDQLVGTVRLLLERGAAHAPEAAPPSPGKAPAPATTTAVPTTAVPTAAARTPLAYGPITAGPAAARRLPSVPVLAGIGIAAIAIIAVGAFLLLGGGRPGASQTALASASASSSALASLVPT